MTWEVRTFIKGCFLFTLRIVCHVGGSLLGTNMVSKTNIVDEAQPHALAQAAIEASV